MAKKGKFSIRLFWYYTGFFILLFFLLAVFSVSSDNYVKFDLFYLRSLLLMSGIWVLSGFVFRKFNVRTYELREHGFYAIFSSAILSFFLFKVIKFFFPTIIFGKLFFAVLILGTTLGEILILMFNYYFKFAKEIENADIYINENKKNEIENKQHLFRALDAKIVEQVKDIIIETLGNRGFTWISRQVNLMSSETVVHNTATRYNIQLITNENVGCIVNLRRINDHRFLNKFFEIVNEKLPDGALYVGIGETIDTRYTNIVRKRIPPFSYICLFCDFIFHRITPKLPFFQKIYFWITKGENRAISKAEILGRLYCCGFEIVNHTTINGQFLFCVRKIKNPSYDMMPTYGPLVALNRVGKDGKMIRVYKMRTMYPYSEYIQKYLVEQNGYDEVGKIRNDYRVTRWGRWFRKVWLDELPQLLNVVKGQLAIVGVRPLSVTKFNEMPDDLQKERIKYKPGCIPPYVSLCLPDEDGNVQAERIYLKKKQKNSLGTDISYFFKAVYNILSGKIRSA